ncbi:MAG: TspO/MBR family protein [Acetobacteraceae bacterium]|nr:TspO/MBR family protein [Acetobacteraceae bacterium]
MQKSAAAIVAGVAAAGALLAGSRFNPGPQHPGTALWYARLEKPDFTPPGPVFGLAWTALDGLLGYTGYRLLTRRRSIARRWALGAWLLTLFGIPAFSWRFFGGHRSDEALGVSATMLASSVGLTAAASEVDRNAMIASAPLIAWLIFATALQEEVWRRNR